MIRPSYWLLAILLTLLTFGCARKNAAQVAADDPHSAQEPPPSRGAHTPSQAPAASPQARSKRGDLAPVEESAAEQSKDGYGAPAPQRRPGLATRWGEERQSHIREVSFQRDSYDPAASLAIFYDDSQGIRAATGRSSDYTYAGVFPALGGALTVGIVDASGDPLPGMQAGGRNYVVGKQGRRYQIRITNHTGSRFEVVASVDGLDVIDGEDGSYEKRGYIIGPWATLDIEGFRDSYTSVHAFRFGDVEDSYAVQRGKGGNVGVIGVALFPEYGQRRYVDWQREQADPFPGRFAPPPQNW